MELKESVLSESHSKQSMLDSDSEDGPFSSHFHWGHRQGCAHTLSAHSQNSLQVVLKCPMAPREDCYGCSPDLRGS